MKSTLISAVFLSSVAFFGCAQANSDIDLSTSEVEAIIKNYLLKNPEVLPMHCMKTQEIHILDKKMQK